MSSSSNETAKDMRPPSLHQPQAHRVYVRTLVEHDGLNLTRAPDSEYCLEQLRGEISNMLGNETLYADKIKNLEAELNVYKRAYNDVDSERQQLDKSKQDLENQIKGFRVVTLIDGDGTIFSGDLIVQGKAGGQAAAQKLSDSIMQHLTSVYGANQYQLSVCVFLNKRGLVDIFGRVGNAMAKHKFEDFMIGFNQAAERFLMVDVGDAKEAADAKIKTRLEDEIRLPQTCKIIFGGCHDNGYVTTLRSQITAGFKQKLILLRSYTDLAAGIANLELPVLTIPDLFLTQKLMMPHPAQVVLGDQTSNNSSPRVHPTHSPASVPMPLALPEIDQGFGVDPESMVETESFGFPRRPSVPPTFSFAVKHTQQRAPTPDWDSSVSTTSGPSHNLPTTTGSRHINPNIPLTNLKPPPCTLFYLASCKYGTSCKFGHDYILEAKHILEIRVNGKKGPCSAINKGVPCPWGDDCCYGHYCPQSTKCYFFKQGRCKFRGADMHKEPKIQPDEQI